MPHLTPLDFHKGWRALERTKSVEKRDPIYLENKELGSGAHETSGATPQTASSHPHFFPQITSTCSPPLEAFIFSLGYFSIV